jgi:hypothetical protein
LSPLCLGNSMANLFSSLNDLASAYKWLDFSRILIHCNAVPTFVSAMPLAGAIIQVADNLLLKKIVSTHNVFLIIFFYNTWIVTSHRN